MNVRSEMRNAELAIRAVVASDPSSAMTSLMELYAESEAKEAFVAALVANLVSSRAVRAIASRT
jgi:hypothetical protein